MSEAQNVEFDGLPLQINVHYIKDLSFENPNPLKTFSLQKSPDVAINVDVQGKSIGDHTYEVELTIRAEATEEKERVYLLELNYAGIFTIQAKEDREIRRYLLVDCPRLLFPFARALVTHTTYEASVMPINLANIDFYKLAEAELAKAPQGAAVN